MGRFTVRHPHTVLGTDVVVYLQEMSAISSREFRKTTLAMLVPEGDAEPAKPEELQALQVANARAHTFDTEDGTDLVWSSDDAMQDSEVGGLSARQLTHLIVEHLRLSGFNAGATDTATRFRDDESGATGGAPTPPDGRGGVRAPE